MATYQDIKKGVEAFCDKTIREANHMDKLELIVGLNENSYRGDYKWNLNPYRLRIEYINEKLTEAYEYNNNDHFKNMVKIWFYRYIFFYDNCIRRRRSKNLYGKPTCGLNQHYNFVNDLACIIMRYNHDQGNQLPENQTYIESF